LLLFRIDRILTKAIKEYENNAWLFIFI
jgi:hypothetical protein